MNLVDGADTHRPLVIGIGGTGSPGSSTDRALGIALAGAERAGARVRCFGGAYLADLPLFTPHRGERCAAVLELLSAVVEADGLVIASPSYHGGVSATVKNAIDYLEDLRDDHRPYLHGRAVGCVITAAGWQSCGTTLAALRSIVHALRGWPTPLGVTLNTSQRPFDPGSNAFGQLDLVGRDVVEFAVARHNFAYREVGVAG
jgi:FMN reductase